MSKGLRDIFKLAGGIFFSLFFCAGVIFESYMKLP